MSRALALVPARGGSKGIPGKNLRPVAGRSLLAWTLDTARRATRVERVVVSTDDGPIAAEARRHGAEVIDRPAELATDEASSESALLHALEELEGRDGYRPELTVFLQCTAPLTLPADIDATVERLLEARADCCFAAVPFHGFLWRPDPDHDGPGRAVVPVDHDGTIRLRRQDRPLRFLEAGAVYALRTDGFRRARHRFFGHTVVHPLPAHRHLEIDTPEDLERAEGLLSRRLEGEILTALPDRVDALVLDFDGVLTDNRVLVTSQGDEAVLCHRGDGHGLAQLRAAGVELLILSAETGAVVAARARKLGVEALSGQLDKRPVLERWLEERGIARGRTVFVGNDVPDIPCLEAVGCGVAVADAHPRALAAARIVLSRPGGHGAVRELTDAILEHRRRREDAR